jgi:O-antigen/teichoic acid export membrane protein
MSSSKDNIRIAKNTIVVYIRLIVTAVIGLLTSRYVLQILGASDFGLYSVIGGVIAMFTFISVSLQATTVRFINYEMGKQNSDLNKVFNTARQIHVFFAVIIFLIAELVGMYYIQHYLNVDSSKLSDAYYVFHVSIVAACIGIVNVPYQGLLVAHEKFFYVACIDIFNVICKLLMVLMLLYMDGDVLRLYALSMSLLTI